jgi:L,D-transpeptidase YcbB
MAVRNIDALGVIKFMFPNKFNIYLHGTPSRQLFAQTGRAFSHGCIRVHEPVRFAEKLFGLDNSLTPAAIKAPIDTKKTRTASLKAGSPSISPISRSGSTTTACRASSSISTTAIRW